MDSISREDTMSKIILPLLLNGTNFASWRNKFIPCNEDFLHKGLGLSESKTEAQVLTP